MSDSQMKAFENRVAQINKIHAAGGAFEANGALGRSYFDAVRQKRRRRIPLRSIALLFLGIVVLKGAVFARVGAADYEANVATLLQGSAGAQAAGWILDAGGATRAVGSLIDALPG